MEFDGMLLMIKPDVPNQQLSPQALQGSCSQEKGRSFRMPEGEDSLGPVGLGAMG